MRDDLTAAMFLFSTRILACYLNYEVYNVMLYSIFTIQRDLRFRSFPISVEYVLLIVLVSLQSSVELNISIFTDYRFIVIVLNDFEVVEF